MFLVEMEIVEAALKINGESPKSLIKFNLYLYEQDHKANRAGSRSA